MSRRGRAEVGPGHDGRVWLTALAGALPGVAVSLGLLWTGDFSLKVQVTFSVLVVAVAAGALGSVRAQVVRPLQAIANLLRALREGDFAVRGRQQRAGEALATAMAEINALGDTLREQRLGAIDASTLLGKVMEEIDVAIFAFDADGRLRLVNRTGEGLLGAPAASLMGRPAESLRMADLLGGDPQRTIEAAFAGGERRLWQLRRIAFRQRGHEHQLLVLADVQRALRDEERQAWQRLIRVLGHEINNSLAPIASVAASLRAALGDEARRGRTDDDLGRGLSLIERRAESLGRFMTAYSRLARLPAPTLGPVDVGAWLARCAALERRLAVMVQPGAPLSILGDQDQLDQLLINLLRNAADAGLETNGGAAVSWRRRGSFVEIIISDDGPGIADTKNLFVPFFTTKPGGSGIGLVLSRQIAEAHRGSLELRNRADRSGCRAIVRLPI